METEWLGHCYDLREQPELLDTILLWLHAEWLKQRKSRFDNPAEAYAKRRLQLQNHLGEQAVPCTLVASVTRRPLGCISLTRLPSKRRSVAEALWLSNLFVTPTARGQGIARALIGYAEEKARALGERELFLYTSSASQYYLRRGWQQCLLNEAKVSQGNKVFQANIGKIERNIIVLKKPLI